MLTEDVVIASVCDYMITDGWQIVSRAMPNQGGTDVVATRAGVRLEVEAKGAGSSKPHTARYGQLFDQAQVRVQVGLLRITVFWVGEDGTVSADEPDQ
jgi:hypothetical protein